MRTHNFKATLKAAVKVASLLFFGAVAAFGQQQVNLTAGPTTVTMPDGTVVPMWGYTCAGATVIASSTATCAALNPNAPAANPATVPPTPAGWSPVVITVPTGQILTINLTNSLSFSNGNTVPTSLMIVGQLGGGLGTTATSTASPDHSALTSNTATWPIVGGAPAFTPPPQGTRVQSFSTEVAAGATTALTFGTAANPLKPGTYLMESGTHPSIQGPMGLYGILVVTAAPVGATPGTAYPINGTSTAALPVPVTYNAELPLLFGEIDPVQNKAVSTAVNTAGFTETAVWSGQPGGCGNPSSGAAYNTCYPPAVNYTPLYYTINGVAFNKTNSAFSLFQALPAGVTPLTGSVLVRMVNAGSRMHVPSIVGSLTTGQTGAATPVVTGFQIIAEDAHVLPGVPKVQSEVFMAAGKVYDLMINAPAAGSSALAVYDRELSLSGNATARDAGMLAYIGVNGSTISASTIAQVGTVVARPDTYNSVVAGQTLTVSDPSKGVIGNDTNVYGVTLLTAPTKGTLTLNSNGSFTYVPNAGWSGPDSFVYCANGSVSGTPVACSSPYTATATLGAATVEGASGITVYPRAYAAATATFLALKAPGVLGAAYDTLNNPADSDTAGYPLSVVVPAAPLACGSGSVLFDAEGGFTVTGAAAGNCVFNYTVKNSQGTTKSAAVTITFPTPSNLSVTVLDGKDRTTVISDYRWIIEEDRTFYIDPNCTTTTTTPPAGCPSQTSTAGVSPILGVNFHTDYMPYVAQGCTGAFSCEGGQTVFDPTTGTHIKAVCDIGDGVCRADTTGNGFTPQLPSAVHLDPSKRYYISILPGDAAAPFYGAAAVGHGMGGAPIAAACSPAPCSVGTFAPVTVLSQPAPYPPGKYSVIVFEDDFPLNGEQDTGGGTGVVNTNNEQGLGGFQIHLWDAMAKFGDFTGQMSYDMFNQPLTNSLAGTIDPVTGKDACPVSLESRIGTIPDPNNPGKFILDPTQTGKTGMIVTCPTFEADGVTPSPLAGQAVVDNLMPGQWAGIATPGADRIARGEEWLQTNTLDGQKGLDVFTRIEEPSYFQEYGPAGFHNAIGFANPAIINGRKATVCSGNDPNLPGTTNCTNTLKGKVTGERLSRTPDERLYSSGSRDAFYWTQCYVSFGDPDGEDFAFTKCNADGTFTLTGLPDGNWRITTFDEWNDQLVDGLSTPVRLGSATNSTCPGSGSSSTTCNVGDIATTQWQINLYTRTFIDDNKDGLSQASEAGIPFANVAVRLRDGQLYNLLATDFNGTANFNETFPLFNWYTVETDTTRYKNTGTHVVYDVGGPADGSASCGVTGYPPCGNSVIGKYLANTAEVVSVPTNLRVPGAVYCATADCTGKSITGIGGSSTSDSPSSCSTSATGVTTCSTTLSSGRIDPPWVGVEGWQGFSGQNSFLEFGKAPYYEGENGGIHGHVVYASTRPFDDPMMLVQTQWTPLVPNVTMNLYQEGFAADGVTPTLKLVDTTKTSSWDDWAQGFHADASGNMIPNMSCPGQGAASGAIPDLFFYSLFNQPNYLNLYNSQHGGPALTSLPNNSQFKCYDGMHNWNQLQPAPYDGMYQFPSVTATNPTTGRPTATNCTICIPDPVPATGVDADPLRTGLPMLPPGKYVVEVVMPPGFELVKEEDKNILIGDNFIAPVTQQFGGLGNIFIIPDQASVAGTFSPGGSGYNANNPQNPTQSLGASPENGLVPAFVPEPIWPCVGEARIVPDYMSIYPQSGEVAPFAGATRRLCDKKEVTLTDQVGAIAKFFIYTSTHTAAKFTGVITDDYTSEFDPFSPTFGEKFSPPDMPVSFKDWTGAEISRVYSDHWGTYNGMTYSSWEVNPPNPTGYSPTMMVVCMNDPGPITDTRVGSPTFGQKITDPLFNAAYSQFCYELPFMPGTTAYEDTPVTPTSAFAGAGYNNVDCSYPDATPAIKEVDGDGIGPWVSANGALALTITSLGDQMVPNYGYTGPSATTAPYNAKTVNRHYGFGTRPATCGNGSNCPNLTIGGVNAVVNSWTDTTITATVRAVGQIPQCAVQQQAQYGGSRARCGELVITAANGKQSIDTVTVTIGGKTPTHVAASDSIQSAIDAAAPGDMIIVDPTCTTAVGAAAACAIPSASNVHAIGVHNELLIMWKPVRLQGVGAATSIINANTHPAGKMDAWRQRVNCLFGLGLNGSPINSGANANNGVINAFDPTGVVSCPGTGWNYFKSFDENGSLNPQVDRLPLEATVGWIADLNGNLAELLQEPSLMGALEGAGITVLSKGVNFPSDPYAGTLLAGFPTGTTLLQNTAANPNGAMCNATPNPFPSNYECNPSSIDGLGITDSSQGGGGVFVHGWGHNLQIANNRIKNNAGTLSGGINVGQGEYPPAYIQGSTTNAAPGSCQDSPVANTVLPYCQNVNVNVHNNYISMNLSTGDELFSSTPAGNGGASFCTGSDYYKFNYNWLCGNMSSGDGGGLGHIGFSYNGDIEHNTILFNQSLNPTIPTNGGGIMVMGAPDADPICSTINPNLDLDCVPNPANSVGPSDGAGPGLVINANLIMGNAAEAGSGGGIAFQAVNGSDVVSFPSRPSRWNAVTVTNNIIADNVAGWDGGGISLVDSLAVNIVNNTIVSNSSTATSGVLFNTIGAPLASQAGTNCTTSSTTSCPQPGGLVAIQNGAVLSANIAPLTVTCPQGHYQGNTATNGTCKSFSYPKLENNIIWQNSSYYIGVGARSAQFQQNVVSLYNAFTSTLAPTQATTGACVARSYWDIGVRGDTGPTNHGSGVTLSASDSVLTNGGSSIIGSGNSTGNPNLISQYCDGSRVPPEFGASGWQVPPGISDAIVPNPIFNLTPVATVDEGNNWINMSWGPLSLTNPTVLGADGNYGGGPMLGNYGITTGSSATPPSIVIAGANFTDAPAFDFYNTPRKPGVVDAGAVQVVAGGGVAIASVTGGPLAFGNVTVGTTSASQTLTLHNTGTASLTGITLVFSSPRYARPAGAAGGTCTGTLAAASTCTINVAFSPTAPGLVNATLTITGSVAVTGSPVGLSGTGVAGVLTATLTPTTWTTSAVRGVGTGFIPCFIGGGPCQSFLLRNTGNVPLTGITQGVLGGVNASEFNIVRLFSTCGPAGNGQLAGQTTLAPNATCMVTVQFTPLTTQTAGVKNATVSVTDAAGTQTSTLTGTAN